MASAKDALRRQRRKELDARRSKSRIRLGSCLESWGKLKETLGFSLHSELAQYLLDSYFSSVCSRCSDNGKGVTSASFFTTTASLQQLVLLVHSHSQQCTFPPSLRPAADPQSSIRTDSKGHTQAMKLYDSIQPVPKASIHTGPIISIQTDPKASIHTDPRASIHTDPRASIHTDPRASIHTDPRASIHTDPRASIHTDPRATIHTDPRASMQAVPKTSAKADPKASIKGLPKASIHAVPRQADPKYFVQADPNASLQAHSKTPTQVQQCLKYACEEGHVFTWCPMQVELEVEDTEVGEMERMGDEEDVVLGQKSIKEQARKDTKKDKTRCVDEQVACGVRTTSGTGAESATAENITESKDEEPESIIPNCSGEDEETEQDLCSQDGREAVVSVLSPNNCTPLGSNEMNTDDCENVGNEHQSPVDREKITSARPNPSKRGRQKRAKKRDPPEKNEADNLKTVGTKRNRPQSVKDDILQICSKRKRKATPKLILPCEFDDCWKIFSSRQYLNHHMKYQHFQQKTFACSHPSCGKSFNFKKHLKEHEKLHSDQKDYICEFCARAFRTSSNLSIHRRIHTGEKPLQCEVCGFTCRQKASLNWHMRKHDAERSYQFPCEVCGRRFEKRDNVTAHRSKSHPEHPALSTDSLKPTGPEGDAVSASENPTVKVP